MENEVKIAEVQEYVENDNGTQQVIEAGKKYYAVRNQWGPGLMFVMEDQIGEFVGKEILELEITGTKRLKKVELIFE